MSLVHSLHFVNVVFTNNTVLKDVPTFAGVHTFCASRKAWFRRHARAIKYTTKMKANFSFCDQIKFNEPVLKSGTLSINC